MDVFSHAFLENIGFILFGNYEVVYNFVWHS
jgi:hypothetical protein